MLAPVRTPDRLFQAQTHQPKPNRGTFQSTGSASQLSSLFPPRNKGTIFLFRTILLLKLNPRSASNAKKRRHHAPKAAGRFQTKTSAFGSAVALVKSRKAEAEAAPVACPSWAASEAKSREPPSAPRGQAEVLRLGHGTQGSPAPRGAPHPGPGGRRREGAAWAGRGWGSLGQGEERSHRALTEPPPPPGPLLPLSAPLSSGSAPRCLPRPVAPPGPAQDG